MFKKILSIVCLCCVSIMCNAFAGEVKDGLECDSTREGKSYYFVNEDYFSYYTCNNGEWKRVRISYCYDDEHITSVQQDGPRGMTKYLYHDSHTYAGFVDTSRATKITEATNDVYEYNPDPAVMCQWCADGMYNDGDYSIMGCYTEERKEAAYCNYAYYKNGENTEWNEDENKCVCKDEGKTWDNTENKCVDSTGTKTNEEKDGVECTAARNGKRYLFSKSEEGYPYYLYQCEDGIWKEINDMVLPCFSQDEMTSPEQKFNTNGFKKVYSSNFEDIYIRESMTEVVTGTGVYEDYNNRNNMCWWCGGTENYIYSDGYSDDVMGCYDNLDEAWCYFALHKNGESVDWDDDNGCVCVDANGDPDATKQWDTTEHKCKDTNSTTPETKCGVECNSTNDHLEIICEENGFARDFYCDGATQKWGEQDPEIVDQNWCNAGNNNVFGISAKPNMSEIKWKDASEKTSIYINTGSATQKGSGYERNFDTAHQVMCFDCPSGWFGFDFTANGNDVRHCRETEQEAWCEFAYYKNGENVKWEDNQCICVDANGDPDATAQWDSTEHECKYKNSNEIDGVKCEGDRLGKYFIFMKNDIGVIAEHCLGTGKWDINSVDDSGKYVPDCFDFNEVTVGKKAPNGFREGGNRADWHVFVDTSRKSPVNGLPDVYEYLDEDKTIICGWCASDKFASLGDNNTVQCYNIENEAWCHFAKIKNNANVEWKDNKCNCIGDDAGKEWDTTEHKCKPKTESDKKEESNNNAQQTCEQKYPNNPTARACCNAGETVAEWNEATKQCKCKDSKKEWKNNRCEDTLTQDKAEAAKKVVQQFVKNTSDKASKWKDVEGNFNTARLASDLTAGVVLGTVGGVVSGVVIKKKQIEKGFEVLHCAIGGQSVADWGDTFTIGFNR